MSTDQPTPQESWRPVPGLETWYDVSDLGRVRGKHSTGRAANGRILSGVPNSKGYLRVRLTAPGVHRTSVVHRLVLLAFVGPQPSPIHECNHKNGIKSDNRAVNLEWVTPVENNAHSVANGFWHPHIGEKHGRSLLTERDVIAIRRIGNRLPRTFLGRWFGVNPQTIKMVIDRRNWKHVK